MRVGYQINIDEGFGMWKDFKIDKPNDWQKCVVVDIGHGEIYASVVALYLRGGFIAETDGLKAENYDGGAHITLDMEVTHWFELPAPLEEK